jgi:hypothetical protein
MTVPAASTTTARSGNSLVTPGDRFLTRPMTCQKRGAAGDRMTMAEETDGWVRDEESVRRIPDRTERHSSAAKYGSGEPALLLDYYEYNRHERLTCPTAPGADKPNRRRSTITRSCSTSRARAARRCFSSSAIRRSSTSGRRRPPATPKLGKAISRPMKADRFGLGAATSPPSIPALAPCPSGRLPRRHRAESLDRSGWIRPLVLIDARRAYGRAVNTNDQNDDPRRYAHRMGRLTGRDCSERSFRQPLAAGSTVS